MKINLRKTKYRITDEEHYSKMETGRWPRECCGRGVRQNSILRTNCKKRCHQKCSGLKRLNSAIYKVLACPKCLKRGGKHHDQHVLKIMKDDESEEVNEFCNLGDLLGNTVTARCFNIFFLHL